MHGSRLLVASAEEPVLAALDLSSGELQVAELRPGVSLLRRLLAFLAPAAETKMMIESQLLLSHDGRSLYLSRWETGAAEREDRLDWLPEGYRGRGVWVIDASTLEVRDRWLPEDEVSKGVRRHQSGNEDGPVGEDTSSSPVGSPERSWTLVAW